MTSFVCTQPAVRPHCRIASNTAKTGRLSNVTKSTQRFARAGNAFKRSYQASRAAKIVCETRKTEVEAHKPENPLTQWAMDEADKHSMLLVTAIAYVWLTNADPACADSLPVDHSQVPSINELWTVAEGVRPCRGFSSSP
eukprot:456402-Prorocentrum_minimum.AAC.8